MMFAIAAAESPHLASLRGVHRSRVYPRSASNMCKSGRPDLHARRSNLVQVTRDCFASLAMTRRLLPLPAAADLLFFALVLHLRDRAEHPQPQLAVGLAIDLHGALVLDDVAGGRVDHDVAARPVGRPALE